jgi:hypothetical protein
MRMASYYIKATSSVGGAPLSSIQDSLILFVTMPQNLKTTHALRYINVEKSLCSK